MHLVDEQHGLAAGHAEVPAGRLDDRADLLDARVDRRQLGNEPRRSPRDDVRDRGLAGARRAPQDQRRRAAPRRPRPAGAAACPDRAGGPGRRPRPASAGASARRAAPRSRPGRPRPPPRTGPRARRYRPRRRPVRGWARVRPSRPLLRPPPPPGGARLAGGFVGRVRPACRSSPRLDTGPPARRSSPSGLRLLEESAEFGSRISVLVDRPGDPAGSRALGRRGRPRTHRRGRRAVDPLTAPPSRAGRPDGRGARRGRPDRGPRGRRALDEAVDATADPAPPARRPPARRVLIGGNELIQREITEQVGDGHRARRAGRAADRARS